MFFYLFYFNLGISSNKQARASPQLECWNSGKMGFGLRLVGHTARKTCGSERMLQCWVIPVVINMFRLPDLLTGENIMCSGRKSLSNDLFWVTKVEKIVIR